MMAGILNRNCIIVIALLGLIPARSAMAGPIIDAIKEAAYHRFFHEMFQKGYDCVRDFEACRANARPGQLPPGKLTPAQIEAIKRSFVEKPAEPTVPRTPPTIRVVPADQVRRPE